MVKKIILFLALTLAVIGCGREKAKTEKEIVVWHWMSDRHEAFEALSDRYEKITGVKVKFSLYAPSDAYAQKIKAAAQTNTLPDIYGVLGEKSVFVGDLLFSGSVGRYDLPGGSEKVLFESIWNKIMSLPDDTMIYPGHGPVTTVGEEKRTNPFLSRWV